MNALIASGLVLFVITLAGQLARALHRQPPPRVLGSELMSIDTERATARRDRGAAAAAPASLRPGRAAPLGAMGRPRRVARRRRRRSSRSPAGSASGCSSSAAVVLFGLATYVASRAVEGGRKADRPARDDRRHVGVPAGPRPAGLGRDHRRRRTALARFDVAFFTESMRGVVGEGGGGYHAIMGTLIITALAAIMSIPIGVLTAIYLVEYGAGRAGSPGRSRSSSTS